MARDPYQSAYPRILDPGGEQPIRGPGLAGRRDSTAPERYIFKTIPPRAPSWIISRYLSLSLPLLLGQPRESRNSRIAEMPRSRRMNALRVQIYYGEVISKIALYLLPRTMRKRERGADLYLRICNAHRYRYFPESSSNNSPWSKLMVLSSPSIIISVISSLLSPQDRNDSAFSRRSERFRERRGKGTIPPRRKKSR